MKLATSSAGAKVFPQSVDFAIPTASVDGPEASNVRKVT